MAAQQKKKIVAVEDEEDDDEEDDDKEEDIKSLLTPDQQRQVLQFYGLDSVDPDKWTETTTLLDRIGMGTESTIISTATMLSAVSDDGAATDLLGLGAAGNSLKPTRGATTRSILSDNSDNKSILTTEESRDPAVINPNSPDFNAAVYLAARYPNASFTDLRLSMKRLSDRLDKRTEFLRTLVRDNLDRFMNSKEAIDDFHSELKSHKLLGDSKGSEPLKHALAMAAGKTESMFAQMLERRIHGDNIRKRLSFYEQNRFLFNLPATLRQSISKKNYDQAVRDYKKGRQYIDLENNINTKIWNEVIKIIRKLKVDLTSALMDANAPLDVQERLIEYLVDIQTNSKGEFEGSTDPAWLFLNFKFNTIIKRLQSMANSFNNKVRELERKNIRQDESELRRRRLIHVVLHNRLDIFSGAMPELQDGAWRRWVLLRRHVEHMATLVAQALPDLARLVRSYVEGQVSKRLGFETRARGTPNETNRARMLIHDVLEAFSSHIQSSLSAASLTPSTPHAMNADVDPLQACFVITRINTTIVTCWDILRSLKIQSNDEIIVFTKLRSLFVALICNAWIAETRNFETYEHWISDTEVSQGTVLPRLFREFCRLLLLSLHDLAANQTLTSTADESLDNAPHKVMASSRERIRAAAFDSVIAFTDVMQRLAITSADSLDAISITSRARRTGQSLAANINDPSIRLLVVLSNVTYVKTTILPALTIQYETLFNASASHAVALATSKLLALDTMLYQQYLASQTVALSAHIERGMLWSGMNWSMTSRPPDIRTYAYETLMCIVQIHSHVTDTAKTVLSRIMTDVLNLVWNCYLDLVFQIGSFGIGGLMQAVLEIEFFQQTLAAYETPTSKAVFQRIHSTLRASTRVTSSGGVSKELGASESKDSTFVQNEYKATRELLKASRKASESQFRCLTT